MILISLHAFFFLCIYISNSHSHSHFYIRSHLLLLLLLLSPHNLFTFLPFYFFTFKRVPTQPLLHRDAIFRTSRRSHRYVGTQFQMHREGVKKRRKSRLQSRETHFQIRQISSCRIRDC